MNATRELFMFLQTAPLQNHILFHHIIYNLSKIFQMERNCNNLIMFLEMKERWFTCFVPNVHFEMHAEWDKQV